ncbi:hypothetical protein ASE78_05525 [Sphingomonas sp. Leaf25]|nr:hypothetical protein ASE78_05525 [Sphingomonas sp. Leaf25]
MCVQRRGGRAMSRALSPRTARRLARAVAICAGVVIGGFLLGRSELAAIAATFAVAIVLSVLLHHHRSTKGNR